MSVRLRLLQPHEYTEWRAVSARRYERDMIENGGFTPEDARSKAERDFDRTLPEGIETPGHHIWAIVDDAGKDVGTLWLAERENPDEGRVAFVYEILVDDDRQGRGLGRAAMLLAEDEARSLGLARIDLNVFGGNAVARGLYRSLGYEERAVVMRKALA